MLARRRPSMLGPENGPPHEIQPTGRNRGGTPDGRCLYCRRKIPHVKQGNRWSRVACYRVTCRLAHYNALARERMRRFRARLAAEMPVVKIYERNCAKCDRWYRGTNQLLCRSCFLKG